MDDEEEIEFETKAPQYSAFNQISVIESNSSFNMRFI